MSEEDDGDSWTRFSMSCADLSEAEEDGLGSPSSPGGPGVESLEEEAILRAFLEVHLVKSKLQVRSNSQFI